MNPSLQKLDSTNYPCLQLNVSKQMRIFQAFLSSLSILSILILFQSALWVLAVLVFGICVLILLQKYACLFSVKWFNKVVQLQYHSNGMWAVKYKQGQYYVAYQLVKPFICKWFCILYLRVPSSKRKITVFIHKDSIPTKKFQLLLYLLR